VSTSSFYDWLGGDTHGPGGREAADARLLADMRELHADDDTLGSPRMTVALRRDKGWRVNHKRVEDRMAIHGLAANRAAKRRSLTKPDASAPAIPDRVGRRFDPDHVDVTWVGDISYIPTAEGWLYLATVIDLASRRLLGWSMSDTPDAQLAVDALEAAVAARQRHYMDQVVFHSDRGTQYTSQAFQAACARLGVAQSMSRTGSCLDNAVAESLFATLKVELVNRVRYQTRREARTSIFAWIHRYNARRPHSSLGYLPPLEYEEDQHGLTTPISLPLAA